MENIKLLKEANETLTARLKKAAEIFKEQKKNIEEKDTEIKSLEAELKEAEEGLTAQIKINVDTQAELNTALEEIEEYKTAVETLEKDNEKYLATISSIQEIIQDHIRYVNENMLDNTK